MRPSSLLPRERTSAAAGLLRPSRVLLRHFHLLSHDLLLRLLRLLRHYAVSRPVTRELRRLFLPRGETVMLLMRKKRRRKRRSPSMRATMTRTLHLLFLTKTRSRHTSVSRASRMWYRRGLPLRKRHLPLFRSPHLPGLARRLSRRNHPRTAGSRWTCLGWPRPLLLRPRRHLATTTTTMTRTTTPHPHMLVLHRLCHRSPSRRPLRRSSRRSSFRKNRRLTGRPQDLPLYLLHRRRRLLDVVLLLLLVLPASRPTSNVPASVGGRWT